MLKSPRRLRLAILFCASALPATAAWATDDWSRRADIIVTGQRPAGEAVSGTKTAMPVVETPQSISVITRTELDMRGVQSLNTALQITAGVTPDQRGANADVLDQFKLRGFDAPQFLDGLKLFPSPVGTASPQVDISRLDRIEVVKGPASALYGQSSPGGLVALSSKLPVQQSYYGGLEATYGTFNLYRLDADFGGALGSNGSTLYRAYGSINGADTQQTFGKKRRYTGSAAITFGAGGDTTLTLLGNFSHDPFNGNYGVVPRIGSLVATANGYIPRDFADGDPESSRISRNQASATYILDQKLGEGWAFHSRGRYTHVSMRSAGPLTTGLPIDASFTTFQRVSSQTRETLKNTAFDNQITGFMRTGGLTHAILFGTDVQLGHSIEASGIDFFGAPPINAYDPVPPALPVSIPGLQPAYDVHERQIGVYAQDQVALGELRLTASGRYDWAYSHVENLSSAQEQVKHDEKFTWRLGALYTLPGGLAPYASYSTSFAPQSTPLVTGNIADPSTGRQFEGGIKYQPPGTAILLTAAYYAITQANVVVTNPVTSTSTQSGKVRSKGVEFEAKVPVFRGFTITAAYSHQKVRDIVDGNPFAVAHPLIGTASENGGLFAHYTAERGALAGLGIGGGVRYVGEGYGGFTADAIGTAHYVNTPSYTLFDGVMSYDLGGVNPELKGIVARINATNIFDKRHITSCFASGIDWCWYGSRRTVTGTISFRW